LKSDDVFDNAGGAAQTLDVFDGVTAVVEGNSSFHLMALEEKHQEGRKRPKWKKISRLNGRGQHRKRSPRG
jgi:hypothetical protein